MGQKTNPISLRLHIDRHFDSCWYPGHSSEYGHYLHTDLNIRNYLKSLFKTLGFHTGRIHVQFYPKKLDIHYFCHPDPLKTKRRRPQNSDHSPSSSFSFKGLSFLRSVREKQKLFSTKSPLTFRETLALERQKALHFEKKIRLKKKPTTSTSFVLKEISQNFSTAETLKNLMEFSSKMRNHHAESEGQKLFVIKGLSTSESFQTIFQKILGYQKGSQKSGHQEFFENSQKFTQSFLKKSHQISQTFEGFEGMCRFLSLPQSLRNTEWMTLPIPLSPTDQPFQHLHEGESPGVSPAEEIQEVSSVLHHESSQKSQNSLDSVTLSGSQSFSEQILQEYSQFFVKSYHPLTSLSSRLQMQKLMFMKGKNLKHIEKMIDQTFGNQTTLIPYKIQSRTQSASFLCQTAIEQFQKNLSFRHIYKGLLKDVQSDPSVQGIRFVCSGRFGGVEMARVESRKYGQTSLHVFSSHIDYAHGHAMTNSGLLGVKIWISYRPMAPHLSSWMNRWSFTQSNETSTSEKVQNETSPRPSGQEEVERFTE